MRSTKIKNSASLLAIAMIVMLAGCSAASASTQQTPIKTPAQNSIQQPAQQPSQTGTSTTIQPDSPAVAPVPSQTPVQQSTAPGPVTATNSLTTPTGLSNRVDVIYFHVNQRCVTCLCFEEHVNKIIEKYFGNDIASGKLTYRVLNSQEPQNAALAQKYGAVGSQLFINRVVNGSDKIEDIQSIWDWNCRNNPNYFELKVKNLIEQSLEGQK